MNAIKKNKSYNFPLMINNISKADLALVISHLKKKNPMLTQSENVNKFEKFWSNWLGVKYSVFVNSGSSANLLSMSVLRQLYKKNEVIVPSLTWVSDISSVLQNNLKPVFVDINMKNLCMDEDKILKSINSKTLAVFITYAQGFNGLSKKLLSELKKRKIHLIEDVCESHGAKFNNKKLGSFGLMSNFSFYYAHHMSTIEGGIVSTNNKKVYQMLRLMRSHGMVRESNDKSFKKLYINKHKDLNEKFIFAYPSYNLRSTEINAIIGINQLKSLDENIIKRNINHNIFLKHINKEKFFTDFDLKGSSNYAFNLILRKPNNKFAKKLMKAMDLAGVEYRRGSAGGGNQLRQPYLKILFPKKYHLNYPITDHIHFYGFYLGNYPSLSKQKILKLCKIINSVK